jgi:hypothetical protein
VAIEAVRTERAGTVAAHEQIDVTNVIRLEHNDRRRRARVEPLPHLSGAVGRSERIESQCLAPRLDARRRHDWLPALVRLPGRMCDTPYPQARRHIQELRLELRVALHPACLLRNIAPPVACTWMGQRGDDLVQKEGLLQGIREFSPTLELSGRGRQPTT